MINLSGAVADTEYTAFPLRVSLAFVYEQDCPCRDFEDGAAMTTISSRPNPVLFTDCFPLLSGPSHFLQRCHSLLQQSSPYAFLPRSALFYPQQHWQEPSFLRRPGEDIKKKSDGMVSP